MRVTVRTLKQDGPPRSMFPTGAWWGAPRGVRARRDDKPPVAVQAGAARRGARGRRARRAAQAGRHRAGRGEAGGDPPSPGGASEGSTGRAVPPSRGGWYRVCPGNRFRRRRDANRARRDATARVVTTASVFVRGVGQENAHSGVVRALASVSVASAAKAAAWVVLSQVFAYLGHAPLFLLLTGFYLIFTGLGTRRPGEPSAYSVFNGFNELPGPSTPQRRRRHIEEKLDWKRRLRRAFSSTAGDAPYAASYSCS